MSIIKHVDPPKYERFKMGIAPFNFVPLPHAVYEVAEGIPVGHGKLKLWERHNEFVPGTHSGWIELNIEALSPIFIRGAAQHRGKGKDRRDIWDDSEKTRLRPEPFLDADGRPVIPGSSLRGAIRNLVEILSFSKIGPVSRKQPFFRSVGVDRIGVTYRNLIVRNNNKPRGGYLTKNGDAWSIAPVNEVVRVPHHLLERHGFRDRQHPSYSPDWSLQHQACWFQRGDKGKVTSLYLSKPEQGQFEEGTLVLSGSSPKKLAEFIFVGRSSDDPVKVPDEIYDRFHDVDQLTSWQEKAFRRDQPQGAWRRFAGAVRQGEPVFFVCDDTACDEKNPHGLLFFGRAQMFRFPYDVSPESLIPMELRTAGLDLAEAMFGRVPQNKDGDGDAIKGRVFFEDCVVYGSGEWLADKFVPQNLAAPKVTAFQEYLTQNGAESVANETTYIKGDKTAIRGHKLYWHRWDDQQSLHQVRNPKNAELITDLLSDQPKDTQSTVIRPVNTHNNTGEKTVFKGRIHFENLSDIELGALLSALDLPKSCAHKIGMGKPLGLGSIRITPTLHIVDREARYSSWDQSGAAATNGADCLKAFVEAIKHHAEKNGETTTSSDGLRGIARLDALFHMLEWDHRPARNDTRYMKIENGDPQRFEPDRNGKVNEFKGRPVLPTPHRVRGVPEPTWKGEMPTAAPTPTLASSSGFSRSSSHRSASSSEGCTYRAISEPPKPAPVEPPKVVGKSGKEKVQATFIKATKKPGIGRVKVNEWEKDAEFEIDCTGINIYPALQAGESIRVEASFEDGKPTTAKFVKRM